MRRSRAEEGPGRYGGCACRTKTSRVLKRRKAAIRSSWRLLRVSASVLLDCCSLSTFHLALTIHIPHRYYRQRSLSDMPPGTAPAPNPNHGYASLPPNPRFDDFHPYTPFPQVTRVYQGSTSRSGSRSPKTTPRSSLLSQILPRRAPRPLRPFPAPQTFVSISTRTRQA